MDHTDEQSHDGTQLNAAAVNQFAQELNDRARGVESDVPSDDSQGNPDTSSEPIARQAPTNGENEASLEAAKSGYKPLESEEAGATEHVFPPDIDPTVTIGGSAEEQGALREEYKHG